MIAKSVKTEKVKPARKTIFELLDAYVPALNEGSIVAIASKIVSLCEGGDRVIAVEKSNKNKLVEQEADYFISPSSSKYDIHFTINRNILIANAGIDESNTGGYHVLWPKDPQETANQIRVRLKEKFGLKKIGVIITDSTSTPLRWGTTGTYLAHSGFDALNDYIGKPDVFGRKMVMSKANVAGDLATVAVVVMGEGAEQTPIAIIEDVPFVNFKGRNPTQEEIDFLNISIEDDLYEPFLRAVPWQKGKKKNTQAS